MEEFKVGDVVLVRGQDGPPMTVAGVGPETVYLVWFDQQDRLRQTYLLSNLLIPFTEEKADG